MCVKAEITSSTEVQYSMCSTVASKWPQKQADPLWQRLEADILLLCVVTWCEMTHCLCEGALYIYYSLFREIFRYEGIYDYEVLLLGEMWSCIDWEAIAMYSVYVLTEVTSPVLRAVPVDMTLQWYSVWCREKHSRPVIVGGGCITGGDNEAWLAALHGKCSCVQVKCCYDTIVQYSIRLSVCIITSVPDCWASAQWLTACSGCWPVWLAIVS